MKKWLGYLLLLFLLIVPLNSAHAQESPTEESITLERNNSFRDAGGAGYGAAVENTDQTGNINMESGHSYIMQTIIPMAGVEALVGFNGKSFTLSKYNQSVLGQTSKAMAYLYEAKPASTTEYLAWLGSRVGFVPQTYAQGVTYARLFPILPLWKAFRDIAFTLLALIMLLIGVMIMFRAKVNPQTVANVENSIPRVIVTIILIWFSFPIASLVIDFMYVIIAAGIGVIGTAVRDPNNPALVSGDPNVIKAIQDFSTGGFGTLFSKTLAPMDGFINMGGGWGNVSSIAGVGLIAAIPAIPLAPVFAIGAAIIMAVSGLGAGITSGDAGTGILAFTSPILLLLIFIVLFFQIFKIFFMLLTAYIQILISIILGPIYLLFNAIPGRDTFSSWIKGLIGNMLSFVITAIMLYMGWAIATLTSGKAFWTPPFIMQGVGVSQAVSGLIALGIVLLIPQAVQMVKQALGVKSQFNVGPSMIMAPITGTVGTGAGLIGQFHTASLGMDSVKKFLGKTK